MHKILVLPTSEPWFSMILNRVKGEEYRKLNQYYLTRFKNYRYKEDGKDMIKILFRNGYSSDSPSFIATCEITIGLGRPEWGASLDVQYFVLKIESIDEEFNIRS